MAEAKSETVPKQMRPIFAALTASTDTFCRARLNEEYAEVCRWMAAALCRKRPSPVQGGNLNTWAGAIVYAVAGLNFLFDKSNPLYLSAEDIAGAFGIAKSTVAAKAKTVRDSLKIRQFDWHWCVPSKLDSYPLAWHIQVNGFFVDARRMPLAVQIEAFERGFIPYVPLLKEFDQPAGQDQTTS